jgi:putative transposase
MDVNESLAHTKWECKYHILFIPKYRRKALFGELRKHLGEVFKRLAAHKEFRIEEGHTQSDHVHMLISIPPKYAVSQVVGYIKGKSAIHIARVHGQKAELCRSELLGTWILRFNGWPGRGHRARIHSDARS